MKNRIIHNFSGVREYFAQVFFEDQIEKVVTQERLMDLTQHYQEELVECYLDGVYVAMHYRDIESKIDAYKYHSDRSHRQYFVSLLAQVLDDSIDSYDKGYSALVHVPMHWSRYILRGFDHMKYMAVLLSKNIGIPLIQPLSSSFSRRQSKLSRRKRLENRKNHFTLKLSKTLPKTIILIDDVISTGSTANECARVLKSGGVEKVIGVFLSSNQ